MIILDKMNDETVTLFNTNKSCGGSSEDTVQVYALVSGLPYNKVKVYTPMGDLTRDNV